MKNILMAAATVLAMQTGITQTDSIPPAPEPRLKLTNLYAGVFTATKHDVGRPAKETYFTSSRLGGGVAYQFNGKISYHSLALVDIQNTPVQVTGFGLAYFKVRVSEALSLNAGYVTTATIFARPHPLTEGQLETNTQSTIPGIGTGIRADVRGDNFKFSGSAVKDGNGIQYSGLVSGDHLGGLKNPKVGAWYTNKDEFGALLGFDYGNLSALTVLNNEVLRQQLILGVGDGRRAYSDQGINIEDGKLIRSEVGVLTLGKLPLGTHFVGCLIGGGYDIVNRKVALYLLLNLQGSFNLK